jgi:hypothetical protein
MGFDSDAPAQIQRIRQNLQECTQTPTDEKTTLLTAIETEISLKAISSLTLNEIEKVKQAVRKTGSSRNRVGKLRA